MAPTAWVVAGPPGLAGFHAFTARMRPDVEPAAPHTAVDNRLSAAAPLEAQVSALVAALQPG